MKTYNVTFEFAGYLKSEVAAESPEQAAEIARRVFEDTCKHRDGLEDVVYRLTHIEDDKCEFNEFDELTDEVGDWNFVDFD